MSLVFVSAELNLSLAMLFLRLCKDGFMDEYPAVSYSKCDFYRLKNPVSFDYDDSELEDVFLDHVKQSSLKESNKVSVSAFTTVKRLAKEIVWKYVYSHRYSGS